MGTSWLDCIFADLMSKYSCRAIGERATPFISGSKHITPLTFLCMPLPIQPSLRLSWSIYPPSLKSFPLEGQYSHGRQGLFPLIKLPGRHGAFNVIAIARLVRAIPRGDRSQQLVSNIRSNTKDKGLNQTGPD